MTKIKIFTSEKEIDLPRLIDSRAIICANSGSGKSYLVRKILEESNKKVMAIVLDIEGEFKTLREKFDFLLIGNNADVELNMKSAHLLPKKLLELNVPTIIDISDLKKPERILYVKKFLEALMEVNRDYWRPCLIVLDEIHQLAGQQEKQDSTYSVIDLATRGRKRGFCLIGCTQRISKLHKDVVAELNNYCVGRTSLDIDMKRSAEILGFNTKQDMLSLRDLEDGEFYVFGTAISKTIEKEKVALSKTTHPKQGMDIKNTIVPPTEKIKQILSKLNELPKEAEKELRELNDYKNEIIRLKRELSQRPKEQITKEVFKTDEKLLERYKKEGFKEAEIQFSNQFKELEKSYRLGQKKLTDIGKILGQEIPILNFESIKFKPHIKQISQIKSEVKPKLHIENPQSVLFVSDEENKLKTGAIRILKFIAMFQELTRNKAKTLCGISSQGTFSTYVQDLKRAGFIEIEGNILKITQEGLNFAGDVGQMPTDTESLINLWSKHLKTGAIRMLRICVDLYPEIITRIDLQEQSGITSKGTFSTYLQDLRRNGLIELNGQEVKASEELFE